MSYTDRVGDVSIGRILVSAFGAIRSAPMFFLGVAVLQFIVPLVIALAAIMAVGISLNGMENEAASKMVPTILVLAFLWTAIYLACQAAMFSATVGYLDGRTQRGGEHLRAGFRVIMPLLGLAIVMTFAVWVGMVLLIVPGVILALMWSVAAPALAIEREGVFAAMGRSRYLTKGFRWQILAVVALTFGIYLLFSAVSQLVTSAFASAGGATPTVIGIVLSILSFAIQTALLAYWSSVQAALYVDLRNAKDGPQTRHLAEIFA